MQKWNKNGDTWSMFSGAAHVDNLENGVYTVEASMFGLYLKKQHDKYTFDYKVYALDREFIDVVKNTYSSLPTNLGVLLTGYSGSGKTVTAKTLCNELNKPVILITQHMDGLVDFLNDIQDPVVIFIDEYEKIYNSELKNEHALLSLMDGSLNSDHKKLFLFTTNSLNVSEYILNRPGRIRYVKKYADLSIENIRLIVKDKLQHPEFEDECVKFMSTLSTITIDIVSAVISEVNIQKAAPSAFKDIFNVEHMEPTFNLIELVNGEPKEIPEMFRIELDQIPFDKTHEGDELEIWSGRFSNAEIKTVINEHTIEVSVSQYDVEKKDYVKVDKVITFSPTDNKNRVFSRYAY